MIASALPPPSQLDRDELLDRAHDDIARFKHATLYVTGGTGFVGSWFVAAVLEANARAATDISLHVLARDPQRVARERPFLTRDPRVTFVAGDVVRPFDGNVRYDAVVHAATAASATLNANEPRRMLETIVRGNEHALAAARHAGDVPLLFTSSGAVYGAQPPDIARIAEDFRGGPDVLDPASAYAEGKRVGELMCALAASDGTQSKIARLFAFIGPYLPLDRHFAAGNFLRDALAARPIAIGGDGSPVRSYLYASEMTVWLWAIFARGSAGRAYNVGSDEPIDIETLARTTRDQVAPNAAVHFAAARTASPPARYVPDVTRIVRELGVERRIGVREAIARTAAWHRAPAMRPD